MARGFNRARLLGALALQGHRILIAHAEVSLARVLRRQMYISYFLDNPLNELARSRPSEVMSRYSISA